MPTPFQCHWCDKPTMNETGICIECEQRYEEGNKDIAATVRELEKRTNKIYKLNDSLLLENEKQENKIKWLEKGLKEIKAQTLCLDDMIQAILDGEPTTADEYNDVQEEKDIKNDLYGTEKYVRISDVNKEIAEEWNRNREEKIKKKANMIESIGYRGEE